MKNLKTKIWTDSEWGSDGDWITCQVLLQNIVYGNHLFIYYNNKYQVDPLLLNESYGKNIQKKYKLDIPPPNFVAWEMISKKMIFEDILKKIDKRDVYTEIDVNFFFSLRDIYHLFSKEIIEPLFTNNFSFMRNNFVTKKTQF